MIQLKKLRNKSRGLNRIGPTMRPVNAIHRGEEDNMDMKCGFLRHNIKLQMSQIQSKTSPAQKINLTVICHL